MIVSFYLLPPLEKTKLPGKRPGRVYTIMRVFNLHVNRLRSEENNNSLHLMRPMVHLHNRLILSLQFLPVKILSTYHIAIQISGKLIS